MNVPDINIMGVRSFWSMSGSIFWETPLNLRRRMERLSYWRKLRHIKLKCKIVDNGPGMKEETLSHIFDIYYRRQDGRKAAMKIALSLSLSLLKFFSFCTSESLYPLYDTERLSFIRDTCFPHRESASLSAQSCTGFQIWVGSLIKRAYHALLRLNANGIVLWISPLWDFNP